jgi:hypothetical protein
MNDNLINEIWHKDSRNTEEKILSDYYNGFRLTLRKFKSGYKLIVSIRRHKKHGIGDALPNGSPVAYFKDCDLQQAKIKAIEHFLWMTVG